MDKDLFSNGLEVILVANKELSQPKIILEVKKLHKGYKTPGLAALSKYLVIASEENSALTHPARVYKVGDTRVLPSSFRINFSIFHPYMHFFNVIKGFLEGRVFFSKPDLHDDYERLTKETHGTEMVFQLAANPNHFYASNQAGGSGLRVDQEAAQFFKEHLVSNNMRITVLTPRADQKDLIIKTFSTLKNQTLPSHVSPFRDEDYGIQLEALSPTYQVKLKFHFKGSASEQAVWVLSNAAQLLYRLKRRVVFAEQEIQLGYEEFIYEATFSLDRNSFQNYRHHVADFYLFLSYMG